MVWPAAAALFFADTKPNNMLAQLAGYTLTRTLPDGLLQGVLTGSYKVYGGVVRDQSGRIVAHLINASNPVSMVSALVSPVRGVFTGLNTYQLYRIGENVNWLLGIAQTGMILSGLSLAVSAAGFGFLGRKVNRIDKKLEELAADLKAIRRFLELQERARLISALRVVRELPRIEDQSIRTQMLINSRQVLGEINEKYRAILLEKLAMDELMPAEEYFILTTLGHARCAAELGMTRQAADDLRESHGVWKRAAQRFVREQVIRDRPQRFFARKYANVLNMGELVGWMDFVEDKEQGYERLDHIRRETSRIPHIDLVSRVPKEEALAIKTARKLVQRDRVLQGYVDQYAYMARTEQKPSQIQQYIEQIPEDRQINGCYVFVTDQIELLPHPAPQLDALPAAP